MGQTRFKEYEDLLPKNSFYERITNKNIKVLVGGVHAEVNPEDFEDKNIDYIIRANGIKTFINILNKLENKKKTNNIDCVCPKPKMRLQRLDYPHCRVKSYPCRGSRQQTGFPFR